MNYLPFAFVKAIHDEKIERSLTHQRRPALMPDPIGLLFAQIHDAIDRRVARITYARQAASAHSVRVDQKPQGLTGAVAQQVHSEVITEEIEQNNVTRSLSSQIYA
jgi:hypothetical protein